jgi:hypothetical protein
MKKLIPLLILVGGTVSGFAQGTVNFENSVLFTTTDASGGARRVYDVGSPLSTTTGVALLGTNYVAELYSDSSASPGSLTPITASISRFRATTSANKGLWANSGINGGNASIVIPWASGQTATLQVKVWDYSIAQTYEAAGAGKTGFSIPFTYLVATAGDPPAKYFMEGLQAFALVPEPSAIALGIMGVAGLLLIRRRK